MMALTFYYHYYNFALFGLWLRTTHLLSLFLLSDSFKNPKFFCYVQGTGLYLFTNFIC